MEIEFVVYAIIDMYDHSIIYIGSTDDIERRKRGHYNAAKNRNGEYHRSPEMYEFMRVNECYFIKMVICSNPTSMKSTEKDLIFEHKPRFNKIHAGKSKRGHQESSIELMRECQRGEKNSMYGMKGMKNPFWGCKHKESSRKTMGKSRPGKENPAYRTELDPYQPEIVRLHDIEKMSFKRMEKHFLEEFKIKVSHPTLLRRYRWEKGIIKPE